MASPARTSTFGYASVVSRSAGRRRVSSSSARTFAPRSARARVNAPRPGPISRTWAPAGGSAASTTAARARRSIRKFWPKPLSGARPCRASSATTSRIEPRSGGAPARSSAERPDNVGSADALAQQRREPSFGGRQIGPADHGELAGEKHLGRLHHLALGRREALLEIALGQHAYEPCELVRVSGRQDLLFRAVAGRLLLGKTEVAVRQRRFELTELVGSHGVAQPDLAPLAERNEDLHVAAHEDDLQVLMPLAEDLARRDLLDDARPLRWIHHVVTDLERHPASCGRLP